MRPRLADLAGALPTLAGVGVLVVWSTDQGGYFARSWYPGALLLLAVLGVAALADPGAWRGLPRAVQVALGALALFTAWTYLSITWADAKGVAWDGANRALLYLVVFALFSRSFMRERGPAIALGAWVAAITLLAVVVLVRLPAMVSGPVIVDPGLGEPFGYSNANAAIWLMALWPALAFASCPTLAPWLRGLAAGAIVVLADTALLSESRGSLVATVIVLAVLLVAVPGRVRTLLTLLVPALAIAATTPHVLHLANAAARDPAQVSRLGDVAVPVLVAALVAGLVVFGMTLALARRPPSQRATEATRRIVAVAAIAVLVAGIAGAFVAADPVDRAQRSWREFKQSDAPNTASPGHLTAGFGGARYNYYRVALDLFADHPVRGIGIDNFAQDYLAHDTAGERPTSPHSLELRMLAQTGLVGAALLLAAFVAGFAAAASAIRRSVPLGAAVATGGALTCAYWIVQGSVDWLWEFPALGGAAFAGLGLAGAAAPRREPAAAPAPARAGRAAWRGRAAVVAGGALALGLAASLAFPWMADTEVRRARASWTVFPAAAYRQLDLAAKLNPLSSQPAIVAGSIAIDRGEVERARRAFAQALERDPRNAYATVWLGAIASSRGQRAGAERLMRRALELAPTDPPTQSAARQARAGRIDLAGLQREFTVFVGQLVE